MFVAQQKLAWPAKWCGWRRLSDDARDRYSTQVSRYTFFVLDITNSHKSCFKLAISAGENPVPPTLQLVFVEGWHGE